MKRMKKSISLLPIILITFFFFSGVSAYTEEPSAAGEEETQTPAPEEQSPAFLDSLSSHISLNAAATVDTNRLYDEVGPSFYFTSPMFTFLWDFALINDGKYTPAEDYILGHYLYLNNGLARFDLPPFSLKTGRFVHGDVIESPYSLFISSEENPALQLEYSLDFDLFFFINRWVQLNVRSELGFPDRGMNFKTYGVRLGDFIFGFQDSVVYLNRNFDAEYFLNPLPQYIVQLVTASPGKPWQEEGNINSLMGFFLEFNPAPWGFFIQILFDDFNLSGLVPDKELKHPHRMAWSLGATLDLDEIGRFGFYHAGATKYTFGSTYSAPDGSDIYPYEYTYLPAAQYQKQGDLLTIDYTDNYIGYKYGENNLAFTLGYGNDTWGNEVLGLDFSAHLEYVVSGSKSPVNPWHEYTHYSQDEGGGTKLFNEPVLEHTLRLGSSAALTWRNFTFHGGLIFGGVFNRLTLVPAADGGLPLFKPQWGSNHLLFNFTLGVSFKIPIL